MANYNIPNSWPEEFRSKTYSLGSSSKFRQQNKNKPIDQLQMLSSSHPQNMKPKHDYSKIQNNHTRIINESAVNGNVRVDYSSNIVNRTNKDRIDSGSYDKGFYKPNVPSNEDPRLKHDLIYRDTSPRQPLFQHSESDDIRHEERLSTKSSNDSIQVRSTRPSSSSDNIDALWSNSITVSSRNPGITSNSTTLPRDSNGHYHIPDEWPNLSRSKSDHNLNNSLVSSSDRTPVRNIQSNWPDRNVQESSRGVNSRSSWPSTLGTSIEERSIHFKNDLSYKPRERAIAPVIQSNDKKLSTSKNPSKFKERNNNSAESSKKYDTYYGRTESALPRETSIKVYRSTLEDGEIDSDNDDLINTKGNEINTAMPRKVSNLPAWMTHGIGNFVSNQPVKEPEGSSSVQSSIQVIPKKSIMNESSLIENDMTKFSDSPKSDDPAHKESSLNNSRNKPTTEIKAFLDQTNFDTLPRKEVKQSAVLSTDELSKSSRENQGAVNVSGSSSKTFQHKTLNSGISVEANIHASTNSISNKSDSIVIEHREQKSIPDQNESNEIEIKKYHRIPSKGNHSLHEPSEVSSINRSKGSEDNSLYCGVCKGLETDDNEFLKCANCVIACHATCAGGSGFHDNVGNWICPICRGDKVKDCAMCFNTVSNTILLVKHVPLSSCWVHPLCLRAKNPVKFPSNNYLCSLCQSPNTYLLVRCSYTNCETYMHPICCYMKNCSIVSEIPPNIVTTIRNDLPSWEDHLYDKNPEYGIKCYCETHSKQLAKNRGKSNSNSSPIKPTQFTSKEKLSPKNKLQISSSPPPLHDKPTSNPVKLSSISKASTSPTSSTVVETNIFLNDNCEITHNLGNFYSHKSYRRYIYNSLTEPSIESLSKFDWERVLLPEYSLQLLDLVSAIGILALSQLDNELSVYLEKIFRPDSSSRAQGLVSFPDTGEAIYVLSKASLAINILQISKRTEFFQVCIIELKKLKKDQYVILVMKEGEGGYSGQPILKPNEKSSDMNTLSQMSWSPVDASAYSDYKPSDTSGVYTKVSKRNKDKLKPEPLQQSWPEINGFPKYNLDNRVSLSPAKKRKLVRTKRKREIEESDSDEEEAEMLASAMGLAASNSSNLSASSIADNRIEGIHQMTKKSRSSESKIEEEELLPYEVDIPVSVRNNYAEEIKSNEPNRKIENTNEENACLRSAPAPYSQKINASDAVDHSAVLENWPEVDKQKRVLNPSLPTVPVSKMQKSPTVRKKPENESSDEDVEDFANTIGYGRPIQNKKESSESTDYSNDNCEANVKTELSAISMSQRTVPSKESDIDDVKELDPSEIIYIQSTDDEND